MIFYVQGWQKLELGIALQGVGEKWWSDYILFTRVIKAEITLQATGA
jgi:hypothetical protein